MGLQRVGDLHRHRYARGTSIKSHTHSGIPRILEWKGSRCRWWWTWPAWGHWEKGLGRRHSPPQKVFRIFVENTFWRILARLFLKSHANGRGSNPPNSLLGTPLHTHHVHSFNSQLLAYFAARKHLGCRKHGHGEMVWRMEDIKFPRAERTILSPASSNIIEAKLKNLK